MLTATKRLFTVLVLLSPVLLSLAGCDGAAQDDHTHQFPHSPADVGGGSGAGGGGGM